METLDRLKVLATRQSDILAWLRDMLATLPVEYTPDDVWLCDDGTLDTVVAYRCKDCGQVHELRYSDSSDYRDETGYLSLRDFVVEVVIPNLDRFGCYETEV